MLFRTLVLLLLLAGASGFIKDEPREWTMLVVELHNEGSTAMSVDLAITGPDGDTQLTISVPAKGVASRTFDDKPSGEYAVRAIYQETRGGQSVDTSQTHTLQTTDCDTEAARFVFRFENTNTAGHKSFSNRGSKAFCEDPQ